MAKKSIREKRAEARVRKGVMASPKQRAQRNKFKRATKVCKGKKNYRGCMKTELKKK